MRLLRFTFSSLLVVLTNLTIAHAQSTLSSATVGSGGSASNLCAHTQELNIATRATCSGTLSDPNGGHYSGAATSAAVGSYAGLGIGGNAEVVSDDTGSTVASMQSIAEAELADGFTLSNFPDNSYFFIVTALSAVPGGSAQGTILEQVDITTNGTRGECVINSFGNGTCSSRVPVSQNDPTVNINVLLAGSAAVSCGPPNCGSASSSFSAGYKAPGGGKVLVIRVVDANGNPVNGATTTSASGHKYPSHFASRTTLTANPNPSAQLQPVTFTATVTSFGRPDTPTGKVTFKDATTGTTLGHVSLSGGVAILTTSALAAGTHTVTANYGGDVWSTPSHSAGLIQTVN